MQYAKQIFGAGRLIIKQLTKATFIQRTHNQDLNLILCTQKPGINK